MALEKAEAYLKQAGFADRIIKLEQSTATVDLAAAALGVEPGRIDNRKYKDTFHIKAKMIPFEEVEAAVGHAPGGVCPFGIKEGITVYLDESLKQFETVYPAAGDDHSAVRLSVAELAQITGASWVDVCKETAD